MKYLICALTIFIVAGCGKNQKVDTSLHRGQFDAASREDNGSSVNFVSPKLSGLPVIAYNTSDSEQYICGLFGLIPNGGSEVVTNQPAPITGAYAQLNPDGSLLGIHFLNSDKVIDTLPCRNGPLLGNPKTNEPVSCTPSGYVCGSFGGDFVCCNDPYVQCSGGSKCH